MATPQFINWIEWRAEQLRKKCQLGPFDRLNPFLLANSMSVPIITPHDIENLDPQCKAHVLNDGAVQWDADTIALPNGTHLIVLNPTKSKVRVNASVMEELSHIFLDHKPTQLTEVNGIVLRTWKQSHETQAYWVGAAALVPRRVIKGAITRKMSLAEVAKQCDVSEDLVKFREKIVGMKLAA